MSVVNSPRVEEGIAVAQANRTEIELRETDVRVRERDAVHASTNHYINKSRQFFPNTKLWTYIDCPYHIRLALLLFVASLFGALGAADSVPNELPLGFFLACVAFFLIYCQHEWVNQRSLPVVLRQPVINHQRGDNTFNELPITELEGVALENYQAGIGFVELTQGKIKFQVFNKKAVKEMADAKCLSRMMLVLFFFAAVYNLYYMVVAYSNS